MTRKCVISKFSCQKKLAWLHHYPNTYSMEQDPWKVSGHSAGQELPCLWNQNILGLTLKILNLINALVL